MHLVRAKWVYWHTLLPQIPQMNCVALECAWQTQSWCAQFIDKTSTSVFGPSKLFLHVQIFTESGVLWVMGNAASSWELYTVGYLTLFSNKRDVMSFFFSLFPIITYRCRPKTIDISTEAKYVQFCGLWPQWLYMTAYFQCAVRSTIANLMFLMNYTCFIYI